jgi:hypothetical protein
LQEQHPAGLRDTVCPVRLHYMHLLQGLQYRLKATVPPP